MRAEDGARPPGLLPAATTVSVAAAGVLRNKRITVALLTSPGTPSIRL